MRHSTDRKARGKRSALALAAAGLAVGVSAAFVPAATAATVTYADGTPARGGEMVSSGLRPYISGGTAEVALGLGSVRIMTYYAAPGFNIVGSATADAGNIARIIHGSNGYANAYSGCSWNWENLTSWADLTCTVTG